MSEGRASGWEREGSKVLLPAHHGEVGARLFGYELLQLPVASWRLLGAATLSASEQVAYVAWLNEVGQARAGIARGLFERAGAPLQALGAPEERLLRLFSWVQQWFGEVAAPYLQRGYPGDATWRPNYFRDDLFGNVGTFSNPLNDRLDETIDAIQASVAHDLAFVVVEEARAVRPATQWTLVPVSASVLIASPHPTAAFATVRFLQRCLHQAAAPLRNDAVRRARARLETALVECFHHAVSGRLPDWVLEGRSLGNYLEPSDFTGQRRALVRRRAPEGLVTAVEHVRVAGWHDSKKSSSRVAEDVQAYWRSRFDVELEDERDQLAALVAAADPKRCWVAEMAAGIAPRDRAHANMLFELERIGGRGFGAVVDPEEDWSEEGAVTISFRWSRRHYSLRVAANGWYSATPVLLVNAVLAEEGPRLWFLDLGRPRCGICSATVEEQAVLARLGIELMALPPRWWPSEVSAELPSPLPPRRARASSPRAGGSAVVDRNGSAPAPRPSDRGRARRTPGPREAFLRELLAPALRGLGLSGTGGRFWCRHGDLRLRVDVVVMPSVVGEPSRLTLELGVQLRATKEWLWHERIGRLLPGGLDRWWVLDGTRPPRTMSAEIEATVRAVAMPALQAVAERPDSPLDLSRQLSYRRQFPELSPARAPRLNPFVGRSNDLEVARSLASSDDDADKAAALHLLGTLMPTSKEVHDLAAWLLEHAVNPWDRRGGAYALAYVDDVAAARLALEGASEDDAEREVRLAARAALGILAHRAVVEAERSR